MKHASQPETQLPSRYKANESPQNNSDAMVNQCFSSSANTYKNRAILQKELGNDLLKLLLPKLVNTRDVILDLGSGPGLFTDALQRLANHTISLDVSSSMLKVNSNTQAKIVCDGHQLSLLDERIDLVFSNLMVQWCDFETVIKEVHRVLSPGGQAVISTLLPGSLFELQQAWQAVDDDQHTHQYQSLQEIEDYIGQMSWQTTEFTVRDYTYYYESARDLARELKSLGANAVLGRKNRALCGKGKWLAMEKAYSSRFADSKTGQLPATYRALLIKLTKSSQSFCKGQLEAI